MEAVRDNIIVKADGPNDYITLKNGKKLWIDTSFDPQRHATTSGEVVAANPEVTSLKKGDRVYFHHNCYRDDFMLFISEDDLIRVPYELIHCKVRGGKIEMVDDMILAQPIKKDEDKTKTIAESNPDPYMELHATITHIPKSYKGELKVGDIVIYEPDSDIPIKIEGTEYFRMKIDWLIAKVIN